MRTVLLFCIVCFISTGILMAGINMKNSVIAVPAAFGLWGLFIWHLGSRDKARSQRKQRERLFDEWLHRQNRYR